MSEIHNPDNMKGKRGRSTFSGSIWPPLVWLLLIWTLSSLPGNHLPAPKIIGFDKLAHVGVYFMLGLLTNRMLRLLGISRKNFWWIYLILAASAALDELHQYLIPQRSVSIWDFVANSAGLGMAFGANWIRRDRS